jgi:hypothetical protein
MLITRRDPFSNKTNSMEIDVSDAQLEDWQNGTLIQNVMPNLTADEREFLMTGITKESWEKAFGAS